MTQTTIIGGLGLSVFALSTFTPTQRFGTMMLTLLVAALVGDLILLPAILAGPLGKYFCPKDTTRMPLDPTAEEEHTSAPDSPAVLPIGESSALKAPQHTKQQNHPSPIARRGGAQ
jgi:hypothetical protein